MTLNKLFAMIIIRMLLSNANAPPIQEVIDADYLPYLIKYANRNDFEKLQFEALWGITNIGSGTKEQSDILIEAGILELLVDKLDLKHHSDFIVEQSIWALGNIAGDQDKEPNEILETLAFKAAVDLLDSIKVGSSLMRNISWTICNILRRKNKPQKEYIVELIPKWLNVLESETNIEAIQDIMWGYSYISNSIDDSEIVNELIKCEVHQKCIAYLAHSETSIVIPALRIIGNLLSGEDSNSEILIKSGLLNKFVVLLSHDNKIIRKEVGWSLSNVLASTKECILQAMELGIFEKFSTMIENESEDVNKEIAYGLANITACNNDPQLIMKMKNNKLIDMMVSLIKILSNHAKSVMVLLEGFLNILKTGESHFKNQNGDNIFAEYIEEIGGLDEIEGLQEHSNDSIYNLSFNILETYYQID